MKSYVIDACVAVKWIFPKRKEENYISQAIHLLQTIKQGSIKVLQPTHWLAETAAVVVRIEPKIAEEVVKILSDMELPIIDTPEIYQIACQLSIHLNHHLFDTLYHAVAIHTGNAKFITADDLYYKKASKQGNIIRLADFHIEH